MKYKHIEAARELRLWLAQIVIPAVGIMILSPDARRNVSEAFQRLTNSIKRTRK